MDEKIPIQVQYSCPACHEIQFTSIKLYPANSQFLQGKHGPIEVELDEGGVSTNHIVRCDAWHSSESYISCYRPEDLAWVYGGQTNLDKKG